MFLRTALAFSFLALATACGPDASGPNGPAAPGASIQGTWNAPLQTVSNQGLTLSYQIAFTFEANALSVKNTCTSNGTSLTVSARSAATYTANTVTTSQSANEKKSSGGVDCSVSISPATISYSVSGNTLTITADGQSVSLTRVSQ